MEKFNLTFFYAIELLVTRSRLWGCCNLYPLDYWIEHFQAGSVFLWPTPTVRQ